MKKWLFLSLAIGLMPVSMMAQDDDMYFTPSKSKATQPKSHYESTYYSGSSRSVDDYNRRYSVNETMPVDTGDIISFSPVEGVYPDSVSDFALTRSMARWDDYVPETAYWEGYAQGRRDSWGWHSPWYYSAYYPWYDSWYYDPWYYSYWYYGWYDPWYYDYGWGWHYPYYHYGWYGGWGGYHRPYYAHHGGSHYYGNTGTLRRSSNFERTSGYNRNRVAGYTGSSRFDGARNRAASGNSGRGTYNGNTSRSITRTPASRGSSSSGSTYGSSRSSSGSSYGSSRSSSSYGSSSGSSRSSGGSFGGSRSGGSSSSGRSGGGGGGSRSGGGRR